MTVISRTRPIGITAVSIFAIISGLGEVVVGFKGNYLGILSKDIRPSIATAVIGVFYSLGGLSLEILGRIYLVMSGIAPSKGGDAVKIVIGGAISP
jgi:hypothetical protein